MVTELKVLSDLYTLPDANGKQKLVKKNLITRLLVNTVDIRYVEEVINYKGKIVKGICAIKIGEESFRIKHSYESIKDLVSTNLRSQNRIGFKFKKDK